MHDIIFCDECHNIPEIVQLQYAPAIYIQDFNKLRSIYYKTTNSQLDLFNDLDKEHAKKDSQIEELLDIQKELVENNNTNQEEIDNLNNENNSKNQILEKVQKIQTNIDEYAQKIKDLYAEIADKDRVIEKIKVEYEQLNQELIAFPHKKKTPTKEVDEKKKELKVNLEKEKEKNKKTKKKKKH